MEELAQGSLGAGWQDAATEASDTEHLLYTWYFTVISAQLGLLSLQ